MSDVTQPASSRAGFNSFGWVAVLLTTGPRFPAVVPYCLEGGPVPKTIPSVHCGALEKKCYQVCPLLLSSKVQKYCRLDTGALPPITLSKLVFITTLLVICSLHFTTGKTEAQ